MKKIFAMLLVAFTIITLTACGENATPKPETTTKTRAVPVTQEDDTEDNHFYCMKKLACEKTPLTKSYREACLQPLSVEHTDSFLKIEGEKVKLYVLLNDATYRCYTIDGGRFKEAYEVSKNEEPMYFVGYEKSDDGYIYVGRIEKTSLSYMLRDMYY